jgi:hypothetical protein
MNCVDGSVAAVPTHVPGFVGKADRQWLAVSRRSKVIG